MAANLNQPQYQVLTLPLTVARTAERIIDTGVEIESLIFLNIPAGSGVLLRFGDSGAWFSAETMPPLNICPAASEGLFMQNPLGAGNAVIFVGTKSVQAAS